tara:strand:+ start:947 stop:1450 length:504 start_codon:yes stop_codon:yes gene_type:complete
MDVDKLQRFKNFPFYKGEFLRKDLDDEQKHRILVQNIQIFRKHTDLHFTKDELKEIDAYARANRLGLLGKIKADIETIQDQLPFKTDESYAQIVQLLHQALEIFEFLAPFEFAFYKDNFDYLTGRINHFFESYEDLTNPIPVDAKLLYKLSLLKQTYIEILKSLGVD